MTPEIYIYLWYDRQDLQQTPTQLPLPLQASSTISIPNAQNLTAELQHKRKASYSTIHGTVCSSPTTFFKKNFYILKMCRATRLLYDCDCLISEDFVACGQPDCIGTIETNLHVAYNCPSHQRLKC